MDDWLAVPKAALLGCNWVDQKEPWMVSNMVERKERQMVEWKE